MQIRALMHIGTWLCTAFVLTLFPAAAQGDNFTLTFNDLTDTISYVATDNSRVMVDDCPDYSVSEQCNLVITKPSAGATISKFAIDGLLNVSEFGNPTEVSDQIGTTNETTQYFIVFNSLFDSTHLLCSHFATGCQLGENGNVQVAGTVTWSDGTVDTINFQSDVPEPSSALIFCSGALGLFGVYRTRLLG